MIAGRISIRPEVPLIICTGYGAGLTPEKALSLGFCDVLRKPVEADELYRAVRSALEAGRKRLQP